MPKVICKTNNSVSEQQNKFTSESKSPKSTKSVRSSRSSKLSKSSDEENIDRSPIKIRFVRGPSEESDLEPKTVVPMTNKSCFPGDPKDIGVESSLRWDYFNVTCKDFKQVGYCGYGDACIFIHERTSPKATWQLRRVKRENSE